MFKGLALAMSKSSSNQQQAWVKPELAKLGKLADVAGPTGGGIQGGPNSKT
jgi:hypothetical protein